MSNIPDQLQLGLDALQQHLDTLSDRHSFYGWPFGQFEPYGSLKNVAMNSKKQLTVCCDVSLDGKYFTLYTDEAFAGRLKFTVDPSGTVDQLVSAYKRFSIMLIKKYNVHINVRRPNLYSKFAEARANQMMWQSPSAWKYPEEVKQPDPPPEPEYEVNMMEALVGWKSWKLNVPEALPIVSPTFPVEWVPGKALLADCHSGCKHSPNDSCGCGIYAVDSRKEALKYGEFMGEVYGWGRYVRGDKGWRAEKAYPKSFHLETGQENLIDILKVYRVPIFMREPLRLYDPSEDGYTTGEPE